MRSPLRIVAIGLCVCLAGCGQGTVYPKPPAAMHDALAEVDELPPIFGSAAPTLSTDASDASSVTWIVNVHGSEMMRFVARLQPEGEQSTRMKLDLVGVESGPSGNTEMRLQDHPQVKRLYLVAMQEEIESKLEGRTFDVTKTYPALAAATAANIGSISHQLDEAAEADRKRDAANINKAYADEAMGH